MKLELEGGCLGLIQGQNATQSVSIAANGEKRVDWRVKVLKEGEAVIRIKALTDEDDLIPSQSMNPMSTITLFTSGLSPSFARKET